LRIMKSLSFFANTSTLLARSANGSDDISGRLNGLAVYVTS
jgi:hypothetical protein